MLEKTKVDGSTSFTDATGGPPGTSTETAVQSDANFELRTAVCSFLARQEAERDEGDIGKQNSTLPSLQDWHAQCGWSCHQSAWSEYYRSGYFPECDSHW